MADQILIGSGVIGATSASQRFITLLLVRCSLMLMAIKLDLAWCRLQRYLINL
ncbi:MAG: hypothetical protein V7K53_13260 [Nostoc sp.]|uniref:hypothetical protein n=1 Tax=Nostoc sp. TaxID=1180 RepID=UPI002FFA745B